MTKELALRPQYAQYPNPNFLVKPDPKSKSPSRHGLCVTNCVTPINTNFTCECDIIKVHHSQRTTCAMCYTPLLYLTIKQSSSAGNIT